MIETNPFEVVEPKATVTARSFIDDYKKQAVRASTSRRAADYLREATARIVKQFLDFARQAVEIAVSKFLVELCAMIIAAVSGAVMAKYKKNVDITTGGVFYSGTGAQAPQQPQQQSSWGGSAFDSAWNTPRTGTSW